MSTGPTASTASPAYRRAWRVRDFQPSRGQKRCAARNTDITLTVVHRLTDEHYELYGRYLEARHPGGGMEAGNREFLPRLPGMRLGQRRILGTSATGVAAPLAVAVADRVPSGAVGGLYLLRPGRIRPQPGHPEPYPSRSSRRTRATSPYVYLGYWVAGSQKMDYKKKFCPLELVLGRTGGARAPPQT